MAIGGIAESSLIAIVWFFTAFPAIFLAVRFYGKLKLENRLSLDDYFLLFAWLTLMAHTSIFQVKATTLYNVIATSSGQSTAPPLSPPDYVNQMRIYADVLIATHVLRFTSLWSVKLSFLLFFRRLCWELKRQRVVWRSAFAAIIVTYFGCIGTVNFGCRMSAASAAISNCSTATTVAKNTVSLEIFTALDLSTDLFIFLVPTNLLWGVPLPLERKLKLVGLCSLLLVIMAVSFVRIVMATRSGHFDFTWILTWSIIEASTAIIMACLASFKVLYRKRQLQSESIALDTFGTYSTVTSNGHPKPSRWSVGGSQPGTEDQVVARAGPNRVVRRDDVRIETCSSPAGTTSSFNDQMCAAPQVHSVV